MKNVAPARLALISAGVVTAICALTSVALPFFVDHGIIAYVGSAYVRGGLPYVNIWDTKGPLAFAPYAVAELLFGRTMWGVRIFDVLFCGAGSYVFFRGVRPLTSSLVAAWAAFALYFWTASTGWVSTAQPESWVGVLCVFAIAPLLAPNQELKGSRLALSGLLIGCAGLVKPFYLVVGIAPFLSIAIAAGLTFQRRAVFTLALALGVAAPIILALAYFAIRGGLAQAIEVHILFTLSTYVGLRPISALDGWTQFLARPTVALLTPFILLAIWTLRKQPQVLLPPLGWLAALMFGIALQGKYLTYYWIPLEAPLLVLAALGAHSLGSTFKRVPGLYTFVAAFSFAAQVCATPFYDAAKFGYHFLWNRSPDRYYASYSIVGDGPPLYSAGDERHAAQYLKANTNPGDGVFVWGVDAAAAYLADRPTPSRFISQEPLILPGPYLKPYQAETFKNLLARPPVYIIVGRSWWHPDSKAQSLAKFSALSELLAQNYHLDTTFGTLDLYRRNGFMFPRARSVHLNTGEQAPL
jgi:hypothetical protein